MSDEKLKIACIGWGSLIWDPRSIQVQRKWFEDGPILPIEYLRISKDQRLTLVLDETHGTSVRTLWAFFESSVIEDARKSLQLREGIRDKNSEKFIAHISAGEETDDSLKKPIQRWLLRKELDAAVWTNLPPNYKGENGQAPTLENTISHLSGLSVNQSSNAEEYIRKTPKQIDTKFRREFEKEFGWTPID